MHTLCAPEIERYIYEILPERDAVLQEIEREAEKRDIPIVGPAVGRLLYQYARLLNAKSIFEMGSAVGYSTIWWARAVGEAGEVFYTDGDQKNAAEARQYFKRAGIEGRIRVHVGDALQLLAAQQQEFDIIFNDVDKEYYPRVLDLVPSRLRRGGLFITDNVIWSGRVTQQQPQEESTRAIQEFNQRLYAMPEFFTTIVPLRDGLAISVKL
ncbi:MAG: O-methyltransferase [Candidatus Angelobacter sp. Gp1-AA117]|nr:MAG: O-methyltransferase [Candidatus Angelobacter sp. Gp1-AA117]